MISSLENWLKRGWMVVEAMELVKCVKDGIKLEEEVPKIEY